VRGIESLDHRESKFAVKLDRKFAWLLSLQLATTAGILGAMARGFGWI
jgi:cyd operon protein YbgT